MKLSKNLPPLSADTETKGTGWRQQHCFCVPQGQLKWEHRSVLTEAPRLFHVLHLRSVIAAVIQLKRVLRGHRTASKHFGGASWTALLCFCNLQLIRDMPGLESLRHIRLSGFYDEYNLHATVRASITLCMRLQFSEMEGRKWGYYEDDGDLLLFIYFFSRGNHAEFKEELQCMSGWILFTLEHVVSLWEENLKYMSKSFLKWFKVYVETNGLTDFLPFFCLSSWWHGTLQLLNFPEIFFLLLRFIFICFIFCYKWSFYFSFQIIGRFIL